MDCHREQFDKICAIIDAQGFILDNRFHFRELAIRNQEQKCCVEFSAEIFLHRLPREKRQQLIYQTNNIHGLPIHAIDHDCFKSSQALTVLQSWHAIFATEAKPYFGVKNTQLVNVLEQGGIPYVCFNQPALGVPSLKILDQQNEAQKFFCNLHTRVHRTRNLRCALRKVNLLWEWMNNGEPPKKKLKLSGENEIMEWLFAEETTMAVTN